MSFVQGVNLTLEMQPQKLEADNDQYSRWYAALKLYDLCNPISLL